MKLTYDSVSPEYIYLLSKADIGRIRSYVCPDIWSVIEGIRFGLSTKSARAGRMVTRGGKSYRIRVNFCPKRIDDSLRSPLVCAQRRYVEGVKRFGGKPDLKTGTIEWSYADARRYCHYILLHEVGHVAYAEKELPASHSRRSTSAEEDWCDRFSMQLMKKLLI